MGFKHKAQGLGAEYVDGEVVNFEFDEHTDISVSGVPDGEYKPTNNLVVKLNNGEVKRITFATAVVAAGAWSSNIADMLHIGKGKGILKCPLPIEPR